MNVYLNKVDGIADAIVSMYFSKRSWSRVIEEEIRDVTFDNLDRYDGFYDTERTRFVTEEAIDKFNNYMEKLCKWGKKHITMLRFIDFSITVEDIHRGAQDDWDSHAKRFENRIIRASTRLADFKSDEMSDYYKGKIIPTDTLCEMFNIELPQEVDVNGEKYVKAVNGYILKDMKDNKDVKRGLYMESIPSSFIFKINLTEWAHVYKERGKHSNANPEVRELAEKIQDQIEEAIPWFTRDFVMSINN